MNIGIDLGGSHIALGVVNEKGKIIKKYDNEIKEKERENIKHFIEEFIIEKYNECKKEYSIEKIGIAIPGTVNNGEIIKAINLGVENYKVVEKLREHIDVPIILKNDAKCAAIAENQYGCIKNISNAVFLTLGTGIGGAVIYNGKLLEAKNVPGYELGHMIIEKNGKQCKCGNKGCFEQYASMRALKNKIREKINISTETRGREIMKQIVENTDNKEISEVVDEFISNLSIGIANLINIFEPEAIGIGGSFAYYKDIFLPKLKLKLQNEKLLFNKRDEIIISTAELGNDAGIIGASLL